MAVGKIYFFIYGIAFCLLASASIITLTTEPGNKTADETAEKPKVKKLIKFWEQMNTLPEMQRNKQPKNGGGPTVASGQQADEEYKTLERGSLYTLDYRIYITKASNGQLISPWHDIPLIAVARKGAAQNVFNMVVEIPRWTNAKMEMSTHEPMSPIRQDEKDGVPRFVHNVFPYHGYIWNYGALPQTWEDPSHSDPMTAAKGDNDPIDVVEIGTRVHERGAVVQVKVLGMLALLDEGETDWKLVAIDVRDELASELHDIGDVEPKLLAATREWFRNYKIPAKKPPNKFAFNGEYQNREFAHSVIRETHGYWKRLVAMPNPSLNTETHVPHAAFPANQTEWIQLVRRQPQLGVPHPLPSDVDKWHYINEKR